MRKENRIFCNCCGRELKKQGDMCLEDFLHIKKDWGYFSSKDGCSQEADVCEECLAQWMGTFRYAPDSWERTEI